VTGTGPAAPRRARITDVRIEGPRLVLRPIAADEIEAEWQEMVNADPMATATPVDERAFKDRLARSGELTDGWLDLAIDLDGEPIGRIQTFVPPERGIPADVYWIGIGLRQRIRGQGYGREAMMLLTDWLFAAAGAVVVEAPTDPQNIAMRTVFDRIGWQHTQTYEQFGRTWAHYAITRPQWEALHPPGQGQMT
jgi:RimJ/RimL family protein N-acetyltransferase